ncbi:MULTISPECIES: SPOR domain-containing protein [Paraburkholderia]|uniref:SPOR domain-containing protein n=1 Tax=Paraburkholderia TaxID=1822464 RepID=UPI00225A8D9C|nr:MULTISPECIES: SPOR domain-containing protein [Paraburkholderia]MCX4164078.1 SPOR domain-containing protein [Paraburkholderia megapolitana]MDN7159573.1 SPOR domain-containing protein [Paraburkholderia sp. CHISQ3]MDQ6496620.1 SPOR domain-containing protein [Paraburkholderia megapolitana]
MGIFSFGKKDDASTRRGAPSGSSRGTHIESKGTAFGARVERRSRRTDRAGDADAMLLDPTLPEKQRARRRLVGAIALVIAAVVILPMVLDSHPKPVTDDISIDIPNRPVPKASTAPDDTQAGVAPDSPAPDATLAASGLAAANTAPGTAATATAATSTATKPAAKPTPATTATTTHNAPANAAKPPRQAPATQQTADNPPPAAAADADSGTPASPPGSRFAVQLGSFPDEISAKTWATKLKAAGVPAYTERRKQPDGSTRTLLRAGPFADRAAASAAIAKVRDAGLTAGANGSTQ